MRDEAFELHARLEQSHWWFVARRRILRAIGDHVLPSSGGNVVDIGCGTGGNTAVFAPQHHVLGVDRSPPALQVARRQWPGVRFEHCPSEADLASFVSAADLCLLTDVLEHVADDVQLLSRIVAGLCPGSHLLVTVPADMSLWSPHDETHGHYRRYDRDQLQRLWHDLPVTPLLVSYFNARLYPVIKCVRRWNNWRGTSHGHLRTDLRLPPRWLNGLLLRMFAAERRTLLDVLHGRPTAGFRRGVSLLALLRRD